MEGSASNFQGLWGCEWTVNRCPSPCIWSIHCNATGQEGRRWRSWESARDSLWSWCHASPSCVSECHDTHLQVQLVVQAQHTHLLYIHTYVHTSLFPYVCRYINTVLYAVYCKYVCTTLYCWADSSFILHLPLLCTCYYPMLYASAACKNFHYCVTVSASHVQHSCGHALFIHDRMSCSLAVVVSS